MKVFEFHSTIFHMAIVFHVALCSRQRNRNHVLSLSLRTAIRDVQNVASSIHLSFLDNHCNPYFSFGVKGSSRDVKISSELPINRDWGNSYFTERQQQHRGAKLQMTVVKQTDKLRHVLRRIWLLNLFWYSVEKKILCSKTGYHLSDLYATL